MRKYFSSSISFSKFPLWNQFKQKRQLVSFAIEITARCNYNCRHCYINLPANDKRVKKMELSVTDISRMADQAVAEGALWCLITGGEPLLREDFFDIYLRLRKKGLLLSVFTNASLIKKKHINFFKKYPPRDIEITVYGATEKTYERITRIQGSYKAFIDGLNLLHRSGIKIRLKTMAMRSNIHELEDILKFCRRYTKDTCRFDPFLHLRYDRNDARNKEIKAERLSAREITAVEQKDSKRFNVLKDNCEIFIKPGFYDTTCDYLFRCGTGRTSFSVSYDGMLRPCSSLWHPDTVYDLKKHGLKDVFYNFIPKVRDMRSRNREFLEKCGRCPIVNLCMWCPAHAYLETGKLDRPVEYFCEVAHARAEQIQQKTENRFMRGKAK